jgi:TonB family protein
METRLMMPYPIILFLISILTIAEGTQNGPRHLSVAVVDFGNTAIGHLALERLSDSLTSVAELTVLDHDQAQMAARGIGYGGSLNMTLQEGRDLGAAIGCDYYIIGESQTLRRSPSNAPLYYESYASIFLISARTGKLITWSRPSFQAATSEAAERLLLAELSSADVRQRYLVPVRKAHEDERQQRELAPEAQVPVITDASVEGNQTNPGLRLPRPFRQLHPAYPETAARAEVEATVDVLADLDAEGEVTNVEVTRWAGFGLDEATVNSVRQLHFFPAMHNDTPIPIRVLLRYNFRKPPLK